MHEHFERPTKQLKTFVNEGKSSSTFPLTSTNPLHSTNKQFSDVFSVSLNSKEDAQLLLQLNKVLKAPRDLSERASEQMSFCTSERQLNSTVSIASTNVISVEEFRNTYSEALYNKQDSQILSMSEPVYKTPEHSRPFKQAKLYGNEGQCSSTLFSADTDVVQPTLEQFRSTQSIPFLEEESFQNFSKSELAVKRSAEYSERFVRKINFPASERHSSSIFSSTSTDELQPPMEHFRNTLSIPFLEEHVSQSLSKSEGILKNSVEHSKASCKQMNYNAHEEQSSSKFLSTSIDMLQPSLEKVRNAFAIPFLEEHDGKILSESEQIYETSKKLSEKSSEQIDLCVSEEHSGSKVSSFSTSVKQSFEKQFSSTYASSFFNEQDATILSDSEQIFETSFSEKSSKQINSHVNEGHTGSKVSSPSTCVLQSFEKQFSNTYATLLCNEQNAKILSNLKQIFKTSEKFSEKSFKQINLCVNEGHSSLKVSSPSTSVLQSFEKKFNDTYASPFYNEQDTKTLSESEQIFKTSEFSEKSSKQINMCVNEGQASSKVSCPTNVLQSLEKQLSNPYATHFNDGQDSKISSESEQIFKISEKFPEKSFKHINCVDKGQSVSKISINMQRSVEEFTNACSAQTQHFVDYPKSNEQKNKFLLKSEKTFETSSLDEKKEPLYHIKNIFIEKKKADKIISALGLSFIQKFAQLAKSCVTRFSSPMQILQHTCVKLKVWHQCSFKRDMDPDSPKQAALHYHKFYIKDCLIAFETSTNKKKGKTLVAEAALNTLVKLATFNKKEISQTFQKHTYNSKRNKLVMDCQKLFNIFSRNIINRTKDEPAIITLKSIASLLDMEEDSVVFKVATNIADDQATEYTSKFFLSGILISYAKGVSIQSSKNLAAEFGLTKLSNLRDYVIHKGELKSRLEYDKDVTSTLFCSSKPSCTHKKKKPYFTLNRNLFDSSIRDEIMLIQRDSLQINLHNNRHRNFRELILDAGNFSQEQVSFDLEEVSTNALPYIKAKVRIGRLELGAGTAFSKEEARTIACAKAFMNMQRKYYTLKVKDEYIEGFLVNLDQVTNLESHSKNKIKKQYLGIKKVKKKIFKLVFPGKDIKDSIEVPVKQPLHKDEKLSHTETKSSNKSTKPEMKTIVTDTKQEMKSTFTDAEPSSADIMSSCIDASSESPEKYHDFNLFVEKIEIMLLKFQESEDYYDLVFSGEFTAIHRNLTVKTAKKLHLRHAFLIDEPKTYVCVRHRYEVTKLLNFLVKNGGSNCKFELIDASRTII